MGEVDQNLVTNTIIMNNAIDNTSSMTNPLDPEEFRRQGHLMIDFLADYYHNIEKYPVRSQVQPGYLRKLLPESAPYNPEPIEKILQDVEKDIIPGITHWQSPNFFAYFQSNGSTANLLGEMLCAGFNTVGFSWIASPSATELESIVMDWLGKMLDLPKSFLFSEGGGGVIQGTTCEAFLCTLIAARQKVLSQIGTEDLGKLVVYCSDQTHFSLQKAAQIAGFHTSNFRSIKTTKANNFRLSPDSLKLSILSDIRAGLIPLYLCATVGTTPTGSVDPLGPLCEVAREYNIWVHVDAAYAGSACICPEFRHFLDGVEGSNSFSFNAHKWLLTSLDCCCLWVKEPNDLISALSTNPEILRNNASESKQVVDYKDWQISLSRRFRALKLWLVVRSHGVANLRTYIRGHVKMAKHFEGLVRMDKRFVIVVPRNLGMVCFRILVPECKELDGNELNKKLLASMNDSGRVFMSNAVIEGIYVIRCAIGAMLTDYRHVNMAWKVVQEHANVLLPISYVSTVS